MRAARLRCIAAHLRPPRPATDPLRRRCCHVAAAGDTPRAPRVLLLGCVGWCAEQPDRDMHVALLRSKLADPAIEIDDAALGDPDVPRLLSAATAVIALEFSAELLPAGSPLALLQVPGAGTDRIDWASLEAHPHVAVANAGGHENACAEYILMGMLNHAHDFSEAASSFRAGSWRMSGRTGGPLHRELSSGTVGILGLGMIGQETAKRAAAFGMRVLGCNRVERRCEGMDEFFPLAAFGAMAEECDYLVLTSALAPETEEILSAEVLGRMREGAMVVNVGRAGLVDEAALYAALESGALGGAMLDVWWQYPTPDDEAPRPSRLPFHELPPTTVMTPHASAWTEEMLDRRWDIVAANVRAAAAEGGAGLQSVLREAV